MRRFGLFLLAALLCGCGPKEFRAARKLERSKEPLSAIAVYADFARRHPKSPKAPEALYRAAEIYRDRLQDYAKARAAFLRAAESGRGTAWEPKARAAALDCPDYFPLIPGAKRVMGDSDSGGRHMRSEARCSPDPKQAGRFRITRKIYAGQTEVGSEELVYEKKDGELRESVSASSAPTVLMKLPAEPGASWETVRDGRKVRFSVLSDHEIVQTRGGKFSGCLEVRTDTEGMKAGWKLDYYAPGVGLVLTSAGSPRGESRIAELISWEAK